MRVFRTCWYRKVRNILMIKENITCIRHKHDYSLAPYNRLTSDIVPNQGVETLVLEEIGNSANQ